MEDRRPNSKFHTLNSQISISSRSEALSLYRQSINRNLMTHLRWKLQLQIYRKVWSSSVVEKLEIGSAPSSSKQCQKMNSSNSNRLWLHRQLSQPSRPPLLSALWCSVPRKPAVPSRTTWFTNIPIRKQPIRTLTHLASCSRAKPVKRLGQHLSIQLERRFDPKGLKMPTWTPEICWASNSRQIPSTPQVWSHMVI